MTIPLTVHKAGDFEIYCGEVTLTTDTIKTIHLPFKLTDYLVFTQVRSYNDGYYKSGSTAHSVCSYVCDNVKLDDRSFAVVLKNPNTTLQTRNEDVSIIIAKKGLYQIDGKNVWVTQIEAKDQTITFPTTFTNPLIFAQPVAGSGYGVVRFNNITKTSADVIVQKVGGIPDYINIMVVDEGEYPSINAYAGSFSSDHNPHTCSIPPMFIRPELILQCQTYYGGQPCWMRAYEIKPNFIKAMVEEPYNWDGYHVVEKCACFVINNTYYYTTIGKPSSINVVFSISSVYSE